MNMNQQKTDEARVADEIVGVLPADSVVRICSDDRDSLRFAVRDAKLRIRSVVLSRASLRRLQEDPARDAKIDYLQRDLVASASSRHEFRYPRGAHEQQNVAMGPADAPAAQVC